MQTSFCQITLRQRASTVVLFSRHQRAMQRAVFQIQRHFHFERRLIRFRVATTRSWPQRFPYFRQCIDCGVNQAHLRESLQQFKIDRGRCHHGLLEHLFQQALTKIRRLRCKSLVQPLRTNL